MKFEWDSRKAASNIVKHGVSFMLAQEVWDDPLHVFLPEQIEDGEERWQAIGAVEGVTILVVVHTHRDRDDEEVIRIIGARRATRYERQKYEEDT